MAHLAQLDDLLLNELQDLLDAERQLTKTLPKMAKAAESEDLGDAFEEHLEQTRGHVDRLEQVFGMLNKRARAIPCHGVRGIIEEGSELIKSDGEAAVRDAGLIGAAQKVEHYEIAAYGTAATLAKQLGNTKAMDLLLKTLEEEKLTDQRLTDLAKEMINPEAAQAGNGGVGRQMTARRQQPRRPAARGNARRAR